MTYHVIYLFLHIQSTIGEVDWEKWFSEENSTTQISGIPDKNAPGDSRDAEDSQVGACQLMSSATGFQHIKMWDFGTDLFSLTHQDSQESFGSSLQCHLTLIILLSFLGLLL